MSKNKGNWLSIVHRITLRHPQANMTDNTTGPTNELKAQTKNALDMEDPNITICAGYPFEVYFTPKADGGFTVGYVWNGKNAEVEVDRSGLPPFEYHKLFFGFWATTVANSFGYTAGPDEKLVVKSDGTHECVNSNIFSVTSLSGYPLMTQATITPDKHLLSYWWKGKCTHRRIQLQNMKCSIEHATALLFEEVLREFGVSKEPTKICSAVL